MKINKLYLLNKYQKFLKTKMFLLSMLMIGFYLFYCGKKEESVSKKENTSPTSSFGVGPIQTKIELKEIDPNLVKQGEKLFNEKCTACHKIDERYVGPPLKGVTKKRSPEWIMNMILEPQKMTQEDPVAKELLAEYLAQMTNQNVNEQDARAILEYLRTIDQN